MDKLYIPTRYPDAFPSGSPFKYYTNTDAQKAIDCSEKILEQIQKYVKSL